MVAQKKWIVSTSSKLLWMQQEKIKKAKAYYAAGIPVPTSNYVKTMLNAVKLLWSDELKHT